jgi:hypothetical protein
MRYFDCLHILSGIDSASKRSGRVEILGVESVSKLDTVGVGESKTLALGGFHPYNPLTGIMLSRSETTGGA